MDIVSVREVTDLREGQRATPEQGVIYGLRTVDHQHLAGTVLFVVRRGNELRAEMSTGESLGLPGKPLEKFAKQIVQEVAGALSLRTTRSQADAFQCDGRRLRTEEPLRIRNRFAISFGDQTRDDNGAKTRPSQVRAAFNSPFWPFVLASTSVGQEGLDFHPYCHAIVHWNLPSNPVDLEQREGRIHRYKGHALRKNIADAFGHLATEDSFADPWCAMFDGARDSRSQDQTDLYPFWISPGGRAKIERHIPLLPHSREVLQTLNLKRSLVLYRMVFGQNRQEDLINYLRSRFSESQISELVEICRIDLSPPTRECRVNGTVATERTDCQPPNP